MNQMSIPTFARPDRMTNFPKPQFTIIVPRIVIEIEIPVALRLGDFIVENSPPDKALMALGHQLQNICPPEKD